MLFATLACADAHSGLMMVINMFNIITKDVYGNVSPYCSQSCMILLKYIYIDIIYNIYIYMKLIQQICYRSVERQNRERLHVYLHSYLDTYTWGNLPSYLLF